MSIFISDLQNIDIEQQIQYIYSNLIKDEKVYRYLRYTSNIVNIENIFNNDIKSREFEKIINFTQLIKNLDNINDKINNLNYHLNKDTTEIYLSLLYNCFDAIIIFKILLNELLNKNKTAIYVCIFSK